MRLYGAIEKVEPQDDGTVRVHGIATSEAVDDQGEIVRASAIRAAIPEYMRFPALREMHQLSAAGTTLEIDVDDDGVTRLVAHVVDPIAVTKVKTQTYRGFSIGGRVTEREAGSTKVISGLVLNEISLVDRPANPEAVFDCWKSSSTETHETSPENEMTDPAAAVAAAPTSATPETAIAAALFEAEAKKTAAVAAAGATGGPVQIWSCGVADHRHVAKADALKCLEKQAAATPEVATSAEALAKAIDTPDPETTTPASPESAAGAEVAEEVLTPAAVEKRAAEGASEAQAAIDAALAAIEKGEAVLAPAEEVEDAEKSVLDSATATAHKPTPEKLTGGNPGPETPTPGNAVQDTGRNASTSPPQNPQGMVPTTPIPKTVAEGDLDKGGDSSKPYGDVEYADNGLQADGKHRYPIDTEAHIRSAWNYINKPKNCAKYGDNCSKVKAKIVAAWKAKIDKDGPPSAKAGEPGDIAKSLYDVGDIAQIVMWLDNLQERFAYESAIEGDDSSLPAKAGACCAQLCALLRDLVAEETAEIMAGTEADDEGSAGMTEMMMAAVVDSLRKTSDEALALTLFEKIGAKIMKAGAKHSAGDRVLLDAAHDCIGKLSDGATCATAQKAGARHSKATMAQLQKAHDNLCEAGAKCDGMNKDDDMAMSAKAAIDAAGNTGSGDTVAKNATAATGVPVNEDLAKALATERSEKAALVKIVADQTGLLGRIMKRVEDIASQPLPPMTIAKGTAVISKGQDGGGESGIDQAALGAALERFSKMSKEDQSLMLIELSHARPTLYDPTSRIG